METESQPASWIVLLLGRGWLLSQLPLHLREQASYSGQCAARAGRVSVLRSLVLELELSLPRTLSAQCLAGDAPHSVGL